MTVAVVVVCAASLVVVVIVVVVRRRGTASEGPSVWELQAEMRHRAPDRPLSVAEARKVDREHRRCDAASCPIKRAALRTKFRAGLMVPTAELHRLLFDRFGAEY
ncbi:MAG: hypothetical protein H5T78_20285 [Nocardia sp.]|nr:hypothetical protein [Nocardia sp.]